MPNPIQLPDDAPFTPEQRQWLSEFLSRMLGGEAGTGAGASGPSVPVTILYGSQTGNAEGLARKLLKTLKKGNFEPAVADMASYPQERLAGEKNLLVITSTYGDGEPPDSAADLHRWLHSDAAPRLEGVRFSVLALGDTEYPDFCKCGIEFDTRLAELGAERVVGRVDCDVDYEALYNGWRDAVVMALGGSSKAALNGGATHEQDAEDGFSKKNPFPAPILTNYNLNAAESEKATYHIGFSLAGSGLTYQVGDALGVFPRNDERVVDEILAGLPFKTDECVPLPTGGEALLRDALIEHYDIRGINKSFLQKWQVRSGSPFLRALVEADDKQAYEGFCWGRELIDLVLDHPADFADAEDFVSILKRLQPRLYSIASSPKTHPDEVHLTVGVVKYATFGRRRGGVCSTFLAERCKSLKPGVFLHENKLFRLPADGSVPVIMVGPGTGIAPFRAFLEERRETGAPGKNWLFFGNPHRATDFLYEEELTAMLAAGHLTRLDTAFSRDQKQKIYVQDRMVEAGAELWAWLQAGAMFYVCGDASRMAKDVDVALHKIAAEHGALSTEAAAAYVASLRKDRRYLRDVY
jgi:sulfite reductase (NADPH) flavoprotein alpha-component